MKQFLSKTESQKKNADQATIGWMLTPLITEFFYFIGPVLTFPKAITNFPWSNTSFSNKINTYKHQINEVDISLKIDFTNLIETIGNTFDHHYTWKSFFLFWCNPNLYKQKYLHLNHLHKNFWIWCTHCRRRCYLYTFFIQ